MLAPCHRRLPMPLVGLALAALALPTAADARIPGVGNGLQPTTDGPDLRSTKISPGLPSEVQFCFDQSVTPGDWTKYRVRTYDSQRYWNGVSASKDTSNSSCVLVQFSGSVSQGTIGEVTAPSAATGQNDFGPAPASQPLENTAVVAAKGRTSGPDLVSASISGNLLRYTFDEPIAQIPNSTDPARLALFRIEDQSANTVNRPSSVVRADTDGRNVIEATFADVSKLNSAILAIASRGAVSDIAPDFGGATLNPDSEILINNKTLTTAAGGLVPTEAYVSGPQTVEIAYNGRTFQKTTATPPADSAPVRVSVYSETGEELPALTIKTSSSFNRLQADFGERFAQQPSDWVAITVSPYIVENGGTIGAGGTLGLNTANSVAGFTSGPDLLSASINGDYDITYRFDEPVSAPSPANTGLLTANLLHLQPLIRFSEGEHAARSDVNVIRDFADKTKLTARHASASNQSVGASVRGWNSGTPTGSAPTDLLGYPAPSGAVSYAVEQPPATPAPTPAPQVVVPQIPALAGGSTTLVRTILKKTKKTKKKKAQPYAVKYSGRLASSSPGCIVRRSITFTATRKNGDIKTLGTATSNSKGAYALALKSRPKGKVTVKVAERPGDNCGAISGGGINA